MISLTSEWTDILHAFNISEAHFPTYFLFTTVSPFLFWVNTSFVTISISWCLSSYAPFLTISEINSLNTLFTTKASFSAIHNTLLSKLDPLTISLAAFLILAVSSTITGGFPGPAAIHFLPLFIAISTTASPPVTANILISLWVIITLLESIVGLLGAVSNSLGPPTSWIALLRIAIVSKHTFLAAGCGLYTTPFPAATIDILLLITVELGFVEGVIDPITPKGANSINVIPSSPVKALDSKSSVPGVFSAANTFLIILSSTLPNPVSSCAIIANFSALSKLALRIAAIISLRLNILNSISCFCDSFAARIASSTCS